MQPAQGHTDDKQLATKCMSSPLHGQYQLSSAPALEIGPSLLDRQRAELNFAKYPLNICSITSLPRC